MRPRLRKLLKIAGIVVVSAGLLTGIGGSIASHYFKREILKRLPELAAKATDSLYRVSVEDLRINIFTGQVTVYDLRITLDSAVLKHKIADAHLPRLLINVHIPQVRLWGVKWSKAIREIELSCRRAELEAPEIGIQITGSPGSPLTTTPAVSLKDIQVGSVAILAPSVVVTGAGKEAFQVKASGGDIQIRDWLYVPHQHDTSRFFYAGLAVINIKALQYSRQGSFYEMNAAELRFNTDSNSLSLKKLYYAPSISYDSAYHIIGHRSTLYNFNTDEARLQSFDWRGFIYHNIWHATQLTILKPDLEIYFSLVPPLNTSPRRGIFPDDFIASLGHRLFVPFIDMREGRISYIQQDDKTLREGVVLFSNLNGIVLHLTNDSLVKHAPTTLVAKGMMFDRSPFKIGLQYNTQDTEGHFRVTGSIDNLTADMVSRPVEVMSLASVKSLFMHHTDMSMHGDKDSAAGTFAIAYEKLRVKLQKFDTASATMKGRNMLSFFANNVILYPANPMPGEDLRVVHPVAYREVGQPFFSLLWKLIFNSVQETAIRDQDMLARFRERRVKHLVKKLQKRTARDIDNALR